MELFWNADYAIFIFKMETTIFQSAAIKMCGFNYIRPIFLLRCEISANKQVATA
jgi:hypothetical protein